jgi:hypothetical protein
MTAHSTKLTATPCIALSVDGEILISLLEEIGRGDVNLICVAQGRVRGHEFENDDENLDSI